MACGESVCCHFAAQPLASVKSCCPFSIRSCSFSMSRARMLLPSEDNGIFPCLCTFQSYRITLKPHKCVFFPKLSDNFEFLVILARKKERGETSKNSIGRICNEEDKSTNKDSLTKLDIKQANKIQNNTVFLLKYGNRWKKGIR